MLEQVFTPIRERILELDNHYKKILENDNPDISNILSQINLAEGKRLRPAMVFLSGGVAGEINHLTQITALGLELLHYSSLLHDDVIDKGCKRRNKPTLNALLDNKIAVLTGDYLLSECMNLIAKTNHAGLIAKLASVAKTMAYGELLQLSKPENKCLTESEYIEIVKHKTAYLISACFEMGIASCISDENIIEKWKNFGEQIGIVFQLKDDLLDYHQSDEFLQKDINKDIKEHKITLPFIIAYERTAETQKQQLLDLYKHHNGTVEEIQKIIRIVTENGGIEYTENMINEMTNR